MFPGASSTGFYHAPLSKGLLVLTGTASLINILFSSSTRTLLPNVTWIQIIRNSKLWQILSSSFYYSTTRNLICGSLLFYTFRIFERRFGSKKYASYIFSTTVIAIGLQLTAVSAIRHLGHEVGLPPPGLFGFVYATVVQYFCDVPPSDALLLLGVPISGKIFTYSIALQMLMSNKESLLAGICGMVAGIIYRFNIFRVQQWLKLPEFAMAAVSRMLGDTFSSATPSTQSYPMGATLEIQRQQQIEHYEQQALTAARMGHLRNRGPARVGQGYADVLVPPAAAAAAGRWLLGGEANRQPDAQLNDWQTRHPNDDNANLPQQPTVEVSEEQVQTLVEMGFSRLAVLHALTTSNNDITIATNILLSQS
ncbi:ubiquitin-associated domain-containing protein 2-like [Montipora capricornis]|uniref:ubiquitin-associated domain-containing protein 2-like n=1 Tax=Montipora foliosa TaxID=591990 RepID=UPI0035F0FC53